MPTDMQGTLTFEFWPINIFQIPMWRKLSVDMQALKLKIINCTGQNGPAKKNQEKIDANYKHTFKVTEPVAD